MTKINPQIRQAEHISNLELEIDRLKQVNSLVNDAYALKIMWKHNFLKAMLTEKNKTKIEIEEYINVLEDFEKQTKNKLNEFFTFLK